MFKMKAIKKIMTSILFCIGLIAGAEVLAHEDHGHDHGKSSMMPAQKGGVVKAYDEGFLELVVKGKNIKVYFYNSDFSAKDLKKVKLQAKAIFPRKKGEEVLNGKVLDNVFELDYENKNHHRYELQMKVEEQGHDHPDTLKFTIEKK